MKRVKKITGLKLLTILLALSLLIIPLCSALTWNRPTTIEATVNLNSTDFWDNHDTPADINTSELTNDAFLPLTGGTMSGNINIGGNNLTNINFLSFNITGCPAEIDTTLEGYMCWDSDKHVLNMVTGLGNIVQLSQEMFKTVRNKAGQTIYAGQVVASNSSSGEIIEVVLANSNITNPMLHNLGIVTIPFCNDNAECIVTYYGEIHDIPTDAFLEGDDVYLSCDGSGNLTNIRQPVNECYHKYLGRITRSHATTGIIDFQPDTEFENGVTIHELGILTNITSLDWVKGKFNWISGDTWNSFNGTTLLLNQSRLTSEYYNQSEINDLVGSISLALFFHSDDSIYTGYRVMNSSIKNNQASYPFTITASATPLGNFTSNNASVIGISGLSSGVYDGHFHGNATQTGYKDVYGYYKLYVFHENGSISYMGQSIKELIDTETPSEYDTHLVMRHDYPLNSGDRIVVSLFADLEGTGNNPSLSFQIDGDTASRFQFSLTGFSFLTPQKLLNYDYISSTEGNNTYLNKNNSPIITSNINTLELKINGDSGVSSLQFYDAGSGTFFRSSKDNYYDFGGDSYRWKDIYVAGKSYLGTQTFSSGSIKDSTGLISFDNEDIITTGVTTSSGFNISSLATAVIKFSKIGGVNYADTYIGLDGSTYDFYLNDDFAPIRVKNITATGNITTSQYLNAHGLNSSFLNAKKTYITANETIPNKFLAWSYTTDSLIHMKGGIPRLLIEGSGITSFFMASTSSDENARFAASYVYNDEKLHVGYGTDAGAFTEVYNYRLDNGTFAFAKPVTGTSFSATGNVNGATLTAGNGWSGSFTNGDGNTVVVTNGIITGVI